MVRKIYNNLRQRRKLMGYSLKQVAFLLGLNDTSLISKWERDICRPGFDNLLSLAIVYGTAVDSLYMDHRNELRLQIKERHQLLSGSPDEQL